MKLSPTLQIALSEYIQAAISLEQQSTVNGTSTLAFMSAASLVDQREIAWPVTKDFNWYNQLRNEQKAGFDPSKVKTPFQMWVDEAIDKLSSAISFQKKEFVLMNMLIASRGKWNSDAELAYFSLKYLILSMVGTRHMTGFLNHEKIVEAANQEPEIMSIKKSVSAETMRKVARYSALLLSDPSENKLQELQELALNVFRNTQFEPGTHFIKLPSRVSRQDGARAMTAAFAVRGIPYPRNVKRTQKRRENRSA